MIENSILSIQKKLYSRSLSLETVVSTFLDNIEKHDKSINAFVEVYEQEALDRAKQLDSALSNGEKCGKLLGAVVSLKNNICFAGHKTSAASKILQNFVSPYSATAVEALLKEDAIIIGSTNCDEFGMGSKNENSHFGTVKNPLDTKRVAGGSSGGAAASVAAGFCNLALGSDTGGSVRQPASFCGLPAYKPTYGKVSRYGLISYASSFDQIGIIGNTIPDIDVAASIISAPDNYDSTQFLVVPEVDKQAKTKKKVAILKGENETDEVKRIHNLLDESFKKMDVGTKNVDFKYLNYLVPTYYIIAMAEASSNLSRYDGVHYGYRADNNMNVEELYTKSRTEGLGDEVKKRIMTGTFILSEGHYDAYYKKAQKVRRLIIDELNLVFKDVDYVICPTTSTSAFSIAEDVDPISVYQSDIYTVLANICGIPAVSLPLFKDKGGMPIGIQIHAPRFADDSLFSFGNYVMKEFTEPTQLV